VWTEYQFLSFKPVGAHNQWALKGYVTAEVKKIKQWTVKMTLCLNIPKNCWDLERCKA
jgi:hypothetical protein